MSVQTNSKTNKLKDPFPKLKGLKNRQALELLKENGITMTKAGLIYWNKKYSLGKKVFGQWVVNKDRLLQLIKSREDVLNGNL